MAGPVPDEAAAAVAERVVALLGRAGPVLVCLDGRSGSGKTTLARTVTRLLRDRGATVTVLHLDHVYPGWDGLATASRLLGETLLPALREGSEPVYPTWSWVRDRPGPEVRVRQADVVLVEGVGSGSRAARRASDLTVWVEAPDEVRLERAMARDGSSYAPHWQRWADQEAAYLASEGPAAAAGMVVRTHPGAARGGPSAPAPGAASGSPSLGP